MSEGWIKLHRKITEWQWYGDSVVKDVFLDLLLNANHKEKNWKGVTVKRGQIITGRTILAERLGFSEMQIRTAINKLKSTSEITTKITNRYSLITINNYDLYQQDNQQPNQQITNKQPTDNQQITTNKNAKNEKNEKKANLNTKRINKKKVNIIPYRKDESYLSSSNLEIVTKDCEAMHQTPFDKPEYLRDITTRELVPLAIEIAVDTGDLKRFTTNLYERYASGTRKNGDPIKNFKSFLAHIIRADQEKLRVTYGKVESWNGI